MGQPGHQKVWCPVAPRELGTLGQVQLRQQLVLKVVPKGLGESGVLQISAKGYDGTGGVKQRATCG